MTLSENQKHIVEDFLDGKDFPQIADELALPLDEVERLYWNALGALRWRPNSPLNKVVH